MVAQAFFEGGGIKWCFCFVLGSKIKVKKENGKILLYTLGNAPDLEIEIFKEDLNKGFPEVSYLQ